MLLEAQTKLSGFDFRVHCGQLMFNAAQPATNPAVP